MQTSELNYFKEILESRKIQILKNIDGANEELRQLGSCEINDEGDDASINNSSNLERALAFQQQEELNEINQALHKVKSNEYGICDMCNDPISFQRLKVKPHAKYCKECREIVEKDKQ